jgi:hypothetical protein
MLAGGLVAGLACYLAEAWSCACWRMQTLLMAADIKKMPEIKGTRLRGLIVSLGGIEDWSRQACGGCYGQTLLVRAGCGARVDLLPGVWLQGTQGCLAEARRTLGLCSVAPSGPGGCWWNDAKHWASTRASSTAPPHAGGVALSFALKTSRGRRRLALSLHSGLSLSMPFSSGAFLLMLVVGLVLDLVAGLGMAWRQLGHAHAHATAFETND